MAHLNIEKISLASRDREKEEQKKCMRRKCLLILINHYLEENGLVNSADVLKSECNFLMKDYGVCDNIHLDSMMQDFESYYFLRYQKLPQLIKNISDNRDTSNLSKPKSRRLKNTSKCIISARKYKTDNEGKLLKDINASSDSERSTDNRIDVDCSLAQFDTLGLFEKYTVEWRQLANLIMQDFGVNYKSIHWCDIIGHEKPKQILKEAVIYPTKYKELFASAIVPWKSVLLYGPTGTGKTSLAAAVATESKATFFNVCVSTLTSKWRGESEKLVKVLFDLSKYYSPTIIFIDEIDALMNHRGSDHEASRRTKTEFFSQLDSIQSNNVFVLAATNMPWELDNAILRRMEKRLLIPLPTFENRILLFEKFLPVTIEIFDNVRLKTELNYKALASVTDNFSASDIELVCKEVKMNLIRRILSKLENCTNNITLQNLNIEPLKMQDVMLVFNNMKPSCINLTEKFNDWKKSYGSE